MELDQTNSINRGHQEMKTNDIEAIGRQQREARWKQRQEAAARQESEQQAQRVERYRSQRIAQLQNALKDIPNRRNAFEARDAEAEELAAMLAKQVDDLAGNYAQRIFAERHQGRGVRLELGSDGANAFFHGATIKKGLRQLALIANSLSFGAPLIDPESFADELRAEENRIRDELAELQLRA